ncbi:MAG: hypothetical protein QXK69_12485 [Candidatus Caldarchaeum sp.]
MECGYRCGRRYRFKAVNLKTQTTLYLCGTHLAEYLECLRSCREGDIVKVYRLSDGRLKLVTKICFEDRPLSTAVGVHVAAQSSRKASPP